MRNTFFFKQPFLVNAAFVALALLLSVAFGSVFIAPTELLKSLFGQAILSPTNTTILYDIRLPHAILVALTGAALAGSGTAYQGLFRNPLADPYLIGVASGAGLGAVFVMAQDWPTTLLFPPC